MPLLLLKEIPRYECLQEASAGVPGSDPSICEVLMNILHTGDMVSQSEEKFLAEFGLNQPRLIVLILLDKADGGSLRSSELADRAKVSRATVTGLLDTMVKAGWVLRAPDPHDRRASNIKITAKGAALLKKVRPSLTAWSKEIFSALSAKERTQLVKLLIKTQEAVVASAAT